MPAHDDLLKQAVAAALAGEWDQSHRIVQQYGDRTACWIHAVLHKIEGDEFNSRYWYARSAADYEDFPDAMQELRAIQQQLDSAQPESGR